MEPIEQDIITTIKINDIREFLGNTVSGLVHIIKNGEDNTQLTSAIIYRMLFTESFDKNYDIPDENIHYNIKSFDLESYTNYLSDQVLNIFGKNHQNIVLYYDHKKSNKEDPYSKYRIFIRPENEDNQSKRNKIKGIWQPIKIQSNIFYG